jgi:hypothetical protein
MGLILLYVVSLGLFFVASQILPFLFIPLIRLVDSVFKFKPIFAVHILVTLVLLYLTQYVWGLLGYGIGWFPVVVIAQNFLASISRTSNEVSKNQAKAVIVGAIIFLILFLF